MWVILLEYQLNWMKIVDLLLMGKFLACAFFYASPFSSCLVWFSKLWFDTFKIEYHYLKRNTYQHGQKVEFVRGEIYSFGSIYRIKRWWENPMIALISSVKLQGLILRSSGISIRLKYRIVKTISGRLFSIKCQTLG